MPSVLEPAPIDHPVVLTLQIKHAGGLAVFKSHGGSVKEAVVNIYQSLKLAEPIDFTEDDETPNDNDNS